MTYPPDPCTFEVHVTVGRRGHGVERFPDEFEMGAWLLQMEDRGAWNSADPEATGGPQIFCVGSDGQRVEIDYGHPRLVMGRVDSRKKLRERAASNGAH